MAERDDNAKERETGGSGSGRQPAPAEQNPVRAEGQDGSLKVHGDKLEKLIPKGRD